MKLSPRSLRSQTAKWTLVIVQIVSLVFGTTAAMANPTGGVVIDGSAAINSAGNTMTITQGTDRAIINWQDFSIKSGEMTQFIQPGANAAVLNRVISSNPSALMGAMQANGKVFLINPNGILVGEGATIDVGAFTASTLDINNAEFMRGGDLHFRGNSNASIVNRGRITALEGDVYMIGARVENHGIIQASHGTVGMAAGHDVKLVDSAHPHLVVRPSAASLGGTGVLNTGSIEAVQAQLIAAHGNVYALAINNEGTVRANGSVTKNGRVMLVANGGKIENTGDLIAKTGADGGKVIVDAGQGGEVSLSGNVNVSGNLGGEVNVLGDSVALAAAKIDASGTVAGGTVLVGGDYQGNGEVENALYTTVDDQSTINADAIENGDGGKVIVWADKDTDFTGTITARGGGLGGNGGLVEISGKETLVASGMVDTTAANGETGQLLLDPGRVDIGGPFPTFTAQQVRRYWGSNNVRITTNDNGSGNPHDINVWEDLYPERATLAGWRRVESDNSFELIAKNSINLYADISNEGNGSFTLRAVNGDVNFRGSLTSGRPGFLIFPSTGGLIRVSAGNNINIYGESILNHASDIRMAAGKTIDLMTDRGDARVVSLDGDVKVANTRNLKLTGSEDGDALLGSKWGTVTIDVSKNVGLRAEEGVAQIGYDGSIVDSDIRITAGEEVIVAAKKGGIAQIGHGVLGEEGLHGGDIRIESPMITTEASRRGTALVGHAGSIGDITFVTNAVNLTATNGVAQHGHAGNGFHAGDITYSVLDPNAFSYINIEAEGSSATTLAQIGHGGIGFIGGVGGLAPALSSDIEATGFDEIFIEAVDDGANTAIRIGHGGPNSQDGGLFGAKGQFGDITLSGGDFYAFAYDGASVQIGHGGRNYEAYEFLSPGLNGDIRLDFVSVPRQETSGEAIIVAENNGAIQIGHGGPGAEGKALGNIAIDAEGELVVVSADESRVRIGNASVGSISGDISVEGGWEALILSIIESRLTIGHRGGDDGVTGDILIDVADELEMVAEEDSIAVVGHSGGDLLQPVVGSISITTDEDAEILAVEGSRVRIGHKNNSDLTAIIGDVTIGAEGELSLESVYDSALQVGHRLRGSVGLIYGDVEILSGDDLVVEASDDSRLRVGHVANGLLTLIWGDIDLGAGGEFEFEAEEESVAIAGHRGSGRIGGDITLKSKGELEIEAEEYSFAHIGHRKAGFFGEGQEYFEFDFDEEEIAEALDELGLPIGGLLRGKITGDITIVGRDDVSIESEEESLLRIGHIGRRAAVSGDITVRSRRDLDVEAEDDSYLAIGHFGGRRSKPITGDINLIVGRDMEILAESDSEIRIGHENLSRISGVLADIGLKAGRDLLLGSFDWSRTIVGHTTDAEKSIAMGDISVVAGRGMQIVSTKSETRVGHDAWSNRSVAKGDIGLKAGQYLSLGGFDGGETQVGHSGSGILSGDIKARSGGDLSLWADAYSTAQIGHGAVESENLICGDIDVAAKQHLSVNAVGRSSTAQIGHGANWSNGIVRGNISVTAGADLPYSLSLGVWALGPGSQARIGHGGEDFSGLVRGSIAVKTPGNMAVIAQTGANAQVGHGGEHFEGIAKGDISVKVGDELGIEAVGNSDARIGHGGYKASGVLCGDIVIFTGEGMVGPGLEIRAGTGKSVAQVGHGGTGFFGAAHGDIFAITSGSAHLHAGPGSSIAQFGHGGRGASGGLLKGNIALIADDNLIFTANPNADTLTLVGHGGLGAKNPVKGHIVLAFDQEDPFAFGGGRFVMGSNARIGADVGELIGGRVMIFGSKVMPVGDSLAEAVLLKDGAVINGITFNSAMPRGTLFGGQWNTQEPFVQWTHEQYGWTLADVFNPSLPYTGPFTFFYLGQRPNPTDFNDPVYDRFGRYEDWVRTLMKMFPNGPYSAYYGDADDRSEGELGGSSSYDTFGQ